MNNDKDITLTRCLLRQLVDLVWNEARESQEVPATAYADELISRIFTGSEIKILPELNDSLISVLGRPNFACARIAEILRYSGQSIVRRSEDEQAAVVYYLLNMYLTHGEGWEQHANEDLRNKMSLFLEN